MKDMVYCAISLCMLLLGACTTRGTYNRFGQVPATNATVNHRSLIGTLVCDGHKIRLMNTVTSAMR